MKDEASFWDDYEPQVRVEEPEKRRIFSMVNRLLIAPVSNWANNVKLFLSCRKRRDIIDTQGRSINQLSTQELASYMANQGQCMEQYTRITE